MWNKLKQFIPAAIIVVLIIALFWQCDKAADVQSILDDRDRQLAESEAKRGVVEADLKDALSQRDKYVARIEEVEAKLLSALSDGGEVITVIKPEVKTVYVQPEAMIELEKINPSFAANVRSYIKFNQDYRSNVDRIIADYEAIVESLRSDNLMLFNKTEELAKIKRSRWCVVVGVGVNLSPDGDLNFGLQLTAGYRVK